METLTCRLFRVSIGFLFMFAVSAAMLLASATTFAQTKKEQTTGTTKWEWSDDGWKLRVAINGKAEFTDSALLKNKQIS